MKQRKCKHCKHREAHHVRFENFGAPLTKTFSLCMHDQSSFWCSISEQSEVRSTVFMRSEGSPCGPDAILWEVKK